MASRSAFRINRYLLGLLVRPLVISLGVVLLALLLERLLRLFSLLANSGSALESVSLMLANLVPYYLGLALPAAFFASIFMVVSKLGDSNELDALLASGRSIAQLTQPYVWVAVTLSVFALFLYGYWQPYSRYEYRSVMYDALHAGWNARLQENMFADAGRGFVLTADSVDGTGRHLTGVFIRRMVDGVEEVTSAKSGVLKPTADGRALLLQLEDGRIVREDPTLELYDIRYESGIANEDFSAAAPPFRTRGDSERELTLRELWDMQHEPTPAIAPARLAGELQARLARALALPLLPLLAFPLGMAAKRSQRAPSVIVACLLLLFLHHGVQLGQSLAQTGKLPAIPAVWTPFLIFAVLSVTLFMASLRSPGENPVTRAVGVMESAMGGISLRRKKAKQ